MSSKRPIIKDLTQGKSGEVVVVKINPYIIGEEGIDTVVKEGKRKINIGIILGAIGAVVGMGVAFFSNIPKWGKVTAGIAGVVSALWATLTACAKGKLDSPEFKKGVLQEQATQIVIINKADYESKAHSFSPEEQKNLERLNPLEHPDIAEELRNRHIVWGERIQQEAQQTTTSAKSK